MTTLNDMIQLISDIREAYPEDTIPKGVYVLASYIIALDAARSSGNIKDEIVDKIHAQAGTLTGFMEKMEDPKVKDTLQQQGVQL